MNEIKAIADKHKVQLFFCLLILAFGAGKVWQSIPLHPQALHISAQCDRASIALNFYQEDMNILVPHIHNRMRGTGIAAAEFPIIQYAVACIYKVAGFNDSYYRTLVMLLFSIGFFFAWKISLSITRDTTTALFCSFLWLSSPTLMYYIPNFNPDPASLGIVLITWYYFLQWQTQPRVLFLLIIFITSCIAILIKASAAISIVAMIALVVLDFLRLLSPDRKYLISKKGFMLTALLLPAIVAYIWYSYASRLNASVHSEFFTLSTRLPQNIEQVSAIWKSLRTNLLLHYYPLYFLALIVPLHMVILFLNKHIPRQLIWCTFILAAGTVSFFFLMFVAMEYHDYYIITLLPWIFFLLLSLATGINNFTKKNTVARKIAFIAGISAIIIHFSYCNRIIANIYSKESSFYQYAFAATPEIRPLLQNAGLKYNDLVVSISDPSYDVSLYLMNQHGYTVAQKKDINRIFHLFLSRNAKWLVTNGDDCLPDLPIINKLVGKPVFTHKNIRLYKPNLNDSLLTGFVLQQLHKHISIFSLQLTSDNNWMEFIKKYSHKTGISVDALIDDSALYLFEQREKELQTMLEEFAESNHHTKEITPEILNKFNTHKQLSSSDLYILQHPYSTWFNNL